MMVDRVTGELSCPALCEDPDWDLPFTPLDRVVVAQDPLAFYRDDFTALCKTWWWDLRRILRSLI